MRVLYFTRDYTPHDYRFLSSLATTGHQVFSLRLERRGAQLEDRPLPPEVEQLAWAGGLKPARWQDGPKLWRSLKSVIRQIRPDLVHAGPLQTSAFLVAAAGFRPLVSMSWGSDLLRDADRNWWWRWATRYTLDHSTVLVGDCQAVRQKAMQLGFPGEKIVIFPWGVDLKRFSPGPAEDFRTRLGWQEAFVLLSLRSWEPIYGVDVLVRGFIQAARELPELRLFLLGTGSLAPRLRQALEQSQVMDRVYFGSQVSQADLLRYYRAADLYLSASHSDGSSVSLMEALACGLPVLVSDIPGNREWVIDGRDGWFFPDGDAGRMAELICQAAARRKDLHEMGRASRARAEERADWDLNFKQLLKAYEMAKEAH
jgi:glycosyltransferase involved in cell wall biosynthesis